jgi:hypothetical protein
MLNESITDDLPVVPYCRRYIADAADTESWAGVTSRVSAANPPLRYWSAWLKMAGLETN